MEITGKIIKLLEPVSGTNAKGDWSKSDVIIETPGNYPKNVCLTFWNLEEEFSIGMTLKAQIEISSRLYNEKYYTDVRAWKHDVVGGQESPEESQGEFQEPDDLNEETDDLPF